MGNNITLKQMRELVREIDRRLDALEALTAAERQELYEPVQFTIPVAGWETDSNFSDFPLYYDVTDERITEQDVVAVDVAPGSAETARGANFATTETFDGGFRLRAKRIPEKPIAAQYRMVYTAYSKTTEGNDDLWDMDLLTQGCHLETITHILPIPLRVADFIK